MEIRIISRIEISRLNQLDRTESVDAVYHLRDGSLVLEREHWDVPDWRPEEKEQRISTLQDLHDCGASILGAFDGELLVGMAVLDNRPLADEGGFLNLAALWVSAAYRGRGIGRSLVELISEAAREQGALALYVSATPSENTIRFYRSLGFHPSAWVDPNLYAKEPEDIHMTLELE